MWEKKGGGGKRVFACFPNRFWRFNLIYSQAIKNSINCISNPTILNGSCFQIQIFRVGLRLLQKLCSDAKFSENCCQSKAEIWLKHWQPLSFFFFEVPSCGRRRRPSESRNGSAGRAHEHFWHFARRTDRDIGQEKLKKCGIPKKTHTAQVDIVTTTALCATRRGSAGVSVDLTVNYLAPAKIG